MKRQALAVALLCALVGGCGQGSEQPSLSLDEVSQTTQAVNVSTTLSLSAGSSSMMATPITAPAGMPFYAVLTPQTGDPDLYLFHKNSSGSWEAIDGSMLGERLVDRLRVVRPTTEDIWFYVRGATATTFNFGLSWESGGQLDLDVPYVNQNTVSSTFGSSACGCTSANMLLAYWAKGKADVPTMQADTRICYLGMSVVNSDNIAAYLRSKGLSSVDVTSMGSYTPAALYAKIQGEIRAGRPMILSSFRFTTAGHFVVVTGFSGSSYSSSAAIIVNDPYGSWGGGYPGDYPNPWGTAKGVPYNFDRVIAGSTGRLITAQ